MVARFDIALAWAAPIGGAEVLKPPNCRRALSLSTAILFLTIAYADAHVVVTPGAPAGTRQLCVDTSGNVTIDSALNLCTGAQTALTGLSVGTGASTTTINGTGVTLGTGATLTANGNATVGGTLGVTGNTSLNTVSTSGAATLNSVGVTNNATVGGTLGVTGATTTAGITNTGNVGTTTLSTAAPRPSIPSASPITPPLAARSASPATPR